MKITLSVLAAGTALLAGCFQDSTAQHSTFLPLDYQSTFQAVRTCRAVAGHGLGYQRVLANPAAAAPYTAGSYPLPAGAVVVAEEQTAAVGRAKLAKRRAGGAAR